MRIEDIIAQRREKLFRTLATIHVLAKIIQIGYFDAIKGTNFSSPKIRSKADQIHKFSEDIIKSLGDAVRLKKDTEEFMEYEHFAEVYELLKVLVFTDTRIVRSFLEKLVEHNRKEG